MFRVRTAPLWLALAAAFACGGDDATPDQPQQGAVPARRFVAVEVAAVDDSDRADDMRDSLERMGWVAYVRAVGDERWAVRVAPTKNRAYAAVLAFALEREQPERDTRVVDDSGTIAPQGVVGFSRVNYGSHGMLARARWALPSDRHAILVVEDAVGVENEPVPNGFFFATEDGMRSVQLDNMWDVAPSPEWTAVAFGRAYVLRGERADTLPTEAWQPFADTIGRSVNDLREAAFPASGMAIMFGLAQPGIVELDSMGALPLAERTRFPVLAGWRVGWRSDGYRIFAGTKPIRANDDAPAAGWVSIDPTDGAVEAVGDEPDLAEVEWVDGPLIDISAVPDTGTRVVLRTDEGAIESQGGWIRRGNRIIGPGIALAATRMGRYVVALAPNPSAEEYEPTHMLVVYTVGRLGG